MRHFTVFFGVLAVLCVTTGAYAIETRQDGNDLLERCEGITKSPVIDSYDSGWCLGFITGMTTMGLSTPDSPFHICSPKDFTLGQGARIIVKYLKDHPAELHYQDALLAMWALQEAFPCPPQPAP